MQNQHDITIMWHNQNGHHTICHSHLCAPGRGGSSHLSQGGGPGCPGRLVPTGLRPLLVLGECPGAGDPMGGVAAEWEGRGQRERGAVPGAAAAVWRKQQWVGWEKDPGPANIGLQNFREVII